MNTQEGFFGLGLHFRQKWLYHDDICSWCSFISKNVEIIENKRQNGGQEIKVFGIVFPYGNVFWLKFSEKKTLRNIKNY